MSVKGKFCHACSLDLSFDKSGLIFNVIKSDTKLEIYRPRYLIKSTCCKRQSAGTLQLGDAVLSGRIWDLLQLTFSPEKLAKEFKMYNAAVKDISAQGHAKKEPCR